MIRYQNAVFSRTRDRLPHSGPALFGPWSPRWWEIPLALHRSRDALVVIVATIAFAVALLV